MDIVPIASNHQTDPDPHWIVNDSYTNHILRSSSRVILAVIRVTCQIYWPSFGKSNYPAW